MRDSFNFFSRSDFFTIKILKKKTDVCEDEAESIL